MKKTLQTILFSCLLLMTSPACAEIQEYFDNFYLKYLELRKINPTEDSMFDYLHKVSNSKVSALDLYLKNSGTKAETLAALSMIDEEYNDFAENLNFEATFMPNCPLKKKQIKKFKRAHKKFMRSLEKKYLCRN